MTIEYKYDNPDGGSFDIDPEDFAGMSADAIRDELYKRAVNDLRSNCHGYVPDLDEYVAEIITANEEVDGDA